MSQFNFPQGWGFDILFELDDGYRSGDLLVSQVVPPTPDWSVIALQPAPDLPDTGRYDAMTLVANPSLTSCFTQTFV